MIIYDPCREIYELLHALPSGRYTIKPDNGNYIGNFSLEVVKNSMRMYRIYFYDGNRWMLVALKKYKSYRCSNSWFMDIVVDLLKHLVEKYAQQSILTS